LRARAQGTLANAIDALDEKAAALEGGGARASARRSGSDDHNLVQLNGELATVFNVIEGPDSAPTTQVVANSGDLDRAIQAQLSRWQELKSRDVAALNVQLRQANLPAVALD